MNKKIKIGFTIAIALNGVMAVANACVGAWALASTTAAVAILTWLIYRQARLIDKLVEENIKLRNENTYWKYRHLHPKYDKILTDIENSGGYLADWFNGLVNRRRDLSLDMNGFSWDKCDDVFTYEGLQKSDVTSNDSSKPCSTT